MRTHNLSTLEIVAALSAQDMDRRKAALRTLFEHPSLREQVINHVRRNHGNLQDGEDVFQEAIIVFDRKIREGQYRGEGDLAAFFMGIVRWHWYNIYHRTLKSPVQMQGNMPESIHSLDPEIEFLLTERKELLGKLLEKLNEKCREILKMYQLDFNMDEIALAMKYANAGVAKKEAFLCRKRFRTLLENHPEIWKDMIKNTLS